MRNRLKLIWQRLLLDNFIVKMMKDRVLMIMYGPFFFQGLSAAIQFDLFTILSSRGPMRRSEIAQTLGISIKSARNLLTLLVSVNLIKTKFFGDSEDPTYKNTFLGKHYFNRNSPLQITSIVHWFHFITYKAMYSYFDSLKSGRNVGLKEIPGTEPTLYQRLAHQPELEKIFQSAMHQLSNLANRWVAEHIDFSSSKHVLDVGGGDGSNLCRIIANNPHLKGTVLDSKTVVENAKKNIELQGLSAKIGTFPGDCFIDPFPENVDTISFCHFLDIWSEDQDQKLLKKAYDCLPVGGNVIIFDIMEKDNGHGPLSAVITSAYFLAQATGHGYMYSAREYERWLKDAGFKNIRRQDFPDEHVSITAEK